MANSSQKGSAYERQICSILSLWWSNNEDDGIFWRTDGSGARSTIRMKKGKGTKSSAGDICAIDPIGQPLLDFISLEVKKGYSKFTLFDLVDKSSGAAKQIIEEWIEQAQESKKQANSYSWMIIAKRDRREAYVIFPDKIWDTIQPDGLEPFTKYDKWLEMEVKPDPEKGAFFIICTTLDQWLETTDPQLIKNWHRSKSEDK